MQAGHHNAGLSSRSSSGVYSRHPSVGFRCLTTTASLL